MRRQWLKIAMLLSMLALLAVVFAPAAQPAAAPAAEKPAAAASGSGASLERMNWMARWSSGVVVIQ